MLPTPSVGRMRLGSLRTENLPLNSAEVSREGQTGGASHASRYQANRIAYRIPQNNLEKLLYSMRPSSSRFQVTRPCEVQTEVSMQIRIFPYMVAASIGVLLAFAYVFGQ